MVTVIIIVCIVVVIIGFVYLLMTFYPPFGGKTPREKLTKQIHRSNYFNGRFFNTLPTSVSNGMGVTISMLVKFIKGNPQGRPSVPLPVELVDPHFVKENQQDYVIWFGHSALLVVINGIKLLIDPMLGNSPSPFPFLGGKRYGKLPMEIEDMPTIDAIILSHDHYDHLDYGSMLKLKEKVKHFFVPLGVGAHLERWGISQARITEMDWWEEAGFEGLTLACTPARHFSGRKFVDKEATLWCSWVICGEQTKLFFSGDSGYSPHFKEIGQKYGPFDMTLMECGQYDERWAGVHMFPEQTIQAQVDVQGKLMIPIHWCGFTLAFHDWTDPVERALKAAKEHDVHISTPRIGEIVWMGSSNYPVSTWWRELITHNNLSGK
ncbi:MBL fold metallo-hydrolase [Paenibacillus macquariensis]|nr:MBL fold metallo-hydrolase [Paenibacillus macquariensis]MEC0089054.1 MBL fold metallo-hydrolase [Paenibacillus macquariensis]